MSATSSSQPLAVPLRPLAETAALFRQECFALDHLVEELYRDVEQLRDELVSKSQEIEDGRKKLAERGRQLAEQRKESGRLVHLLEQQETRLSEALTEIKSLREQATRQSEEAREREITRQAFLEQNVRTIEAERDQLRHELHVLQATAAASGGNTTAADALTPLMAELGDLRRQLSETQNQLDEARRHLAAEIQLSVSAREGEAPAEPLQSVAPALFAELAEMRKQLEATQQELTETRSQLGAAHTQLAAGIDRAAAAAAREVETPVEPRVLELLESLERQIAAAREGEAPAEPRLLKLIEQLEQQVSAAPSTSAAAAEPQTQDRLADLERERIELESELELVRTRATELQEVVTQQRRELVEQRADITTELRLLRELVEEHKHVRAIEPVEEEPALVGAASRAESLTAAPDPVVSSVMAQFARLQKDVAQRRKKK